MSENKFYLISRLFLIDLSGCTAKDRQNAKIVSEVQKIIFETDISNDADDALALDMLYKYMDAGDINLCIMINKEGIYSSEYIDIMNTWYGYPETSVGVIHNGADCENDATNYAKCVSLMEKENGEPIFQRSLKNYSELPEAHILYRKYWLSSQIVPSQLSP